MFPLIFISFKDFAARIFIGWVVTENLFSPGDKKVGKLLDSLELTFLENFLIWLLKILNIFSLFLSFSQIFRFISPSLTECPLLPFHSYHRICLLDSTTSLSWSTNISLWAHFLSISSLYWVSFSLPISNLKCLCLYQANLSLSLILSLSDLSLPFNQHSLTVSLSFSFSNVSFSHSDSHFRSQ